MREHDPRVALDGGADGLAAYRAILDRVGALLKPGGFAAFEVGLGQAGSVAELCRNAGLGHVDFVSDLAGIERVVTARMPVLPERAPLKKSLGKVA